MQAGSAETHLLYVDLFAQFLIISTCFSSSRHWGFILSIIQFSLPEGLGDDLIVEVHDSKGNYCGRAVAQVADIADDPVYFLNLICNYFCYWGLTYLEENLILIAIMQGDKLRWWSIYHEPEHELVGRVQLYINYSTSPDENSHTKVSTILQKSYLSVLFGCKRLPEANHWYSSTYLFLNWQTQTFTCESSSIIAFLNEF